MSKCCICKKRFQRGNGSFFGIPSGERRRKQWSASCRMQFPYNARICSDHFLPSDLIVGTKKISLMPNAVPHLPLLVGDNNPIKSNYVEGESLQTDMVLLNNEERDRTNKVVEPTLKAVTFQFINEALFDETTNLDESTKKTSTKNSICSRNSYSKSVQTGSPELRTCGFIEVGVNTKIYNMRCFHCAAVMPIYSWTKFVTHIKENHQNMEKLYIQDEDLYAETENEISLGNNAADETNNISDFNLTSESSAANISEGVAITTEKYPTEFQQIFYKDLETKIAESDQSLSYYEDTTIEIEDKAESSVDRIQLSKTDDAIVMDFLELFKNYSVLWPLIPDSKEEYDVAVFKVTQLLNNKWKLNLSDFSMRASLNRIKIWYRNVCARGCKSITSRYLPYFQHCEKFLSNTINEHTTKKCFCEICKSCFIDENHLQAHQYKRHQIGELPYKCRLCERRFKTSGLLERHESFHNRAKKFACSDCGKSFYLEKHYKAHLKIHEICKFCGKKCTSKAMYNQHRRRHEPPKHICTICSKGYFQRDRLLEHIKTHRNERDYVCEECGKTFIRQRALACHKESVHSDVRAYVCRICDSSFKTANGLCAHRKAQHLVLTGTVKQVKPSNNFRRKHTYVFDPVTNRRRLVCDVCGNTYSFHAGLKAHKIKVHGFIPLKERLKLKLAAENKNLKIVSNEESIEMNEELTDKTTNQEYVESYFETFGNEHNVEY